MLNRDNNSILLINEENMVERREKVEGVGCG